MLFRSFIANHSVVDTVSAASFAIEARGYLNEIFKENNTAIVCGGTGLYIKALVEGLDNIPSIPAEIRIQVTQLYQEKGIDELRKKLLALDKEFSIRGDINNPQRMMRALEVILHTGTSIYKYHKRGRDKGKYMDNNDDNNDNNYNNYNYYNDSSITFT